MAKMRVDTPTGLHCEIEGTQEEITYILSNYGKLMEHPRTITLQDSMRIRAPTQPTVEELLDIPNEDELVQFILSRPNYEHDVKQIGEYFYHKQIKTREYPTTYRRLIYELDKARKRIEKEKQGAFEQKRGAYRNLKKYVFKPLKGIALENSSKVTS